MSNNDYVKYKTNDDYIVKYDIFNQAQEIYYPKLNHTTKFMYTEYGI